MLAAQGTWTADVDGTLVVGDCHPFEATWPTAELPDLLDGPVELTLSATGLDLGDLAFLAATEPLCTVDGLSIACGPGFLGEPATDLSYTWVQVGHAAGAFDSATTGRLSMFSSFHEGDVPLCVATYAITLEAVDE